MVSEIRTTVGIQITSWSESEWLKTVRSSKLPYSDNHSVTEPNWFGNQIELAWQPNIVGI